jgi:hypothetical protein
MAHVVSSAAPTTKGFVYETPNGTKRFVAHVLFDDQAMRSVRDDFDGHEQVKVSFPIQGAEAWRVRDAKYRGTEGRRFDVHSFAATIGRRRGIDLASLMSFGFATSAYIKGARLGGELVDLQHHGDNARVYDVGKVDERGIAWTSKIFSNYVYADRQDRNEVKDGATIAFSPTLLKSSNLRFELDVFAPALTPRGNVVQTPEEQKKILKRLGISVETDFLPRGFRHRLLKYVANVGSDGNDMRLAWELADPSNFRHQGNPPPGIYPVKIMKGKEVLASFNLDWRE